MADDCEPDPPAARGRIDPKSPEDIANHARQLGVSPHHLSKVVARVGPRLADIYHALGLRPWEIPKLWAAQRDEPKP